MCTRIVTSFIRDDEKLLILKRSDKVRTMKGLWSGISGIIEGDEIPLERARIEIFEETGIVQDSITLLKTAKEMRIISSQYKNHEWEIFPFLFKAENPTVILNWENSEFRWINAIEIDQYRTVPSLHRVLASLL